MKILVISDTHGETDKAIKAIKNNQDIDLIIHLGDYFRDAQKISDIFPGIPIEYIYGNSDFMVSDVPSEKLLQYSGKKIFITHGHRYSVKWDYDKLYRKAEEMKVDVILFGHTHVADMVKKEGYYLVNPGSISSPRDDASESYAIINIDDEKVEPKLCYV